MTELAWTATPTHRLDVAACIHVDMRGARRPLERSDYRQVQDCSILFNHQVLDCEQQQFVIVPYRIPGVVLFVLWHVPCIGEAIRVDFLLLYNLGVFGQLAVLCSADTVYLNGNHGKQQVVNFVHSLQ